MPIFSNQLFTQQDFLQIEQRLYSPRIEEMPIREILDIADGYAPYATEIGYDWFTREGTAKILSDGANAEDLDFVNEHGGRNTQKVYTIAQGVRYTAAELEAAAAKRALGKGPPIVLDQLRIDAARRFIFEKENQIAFVGDTNHNIVGLFNDSFYDGGVLLGKKYGIANGASGKSQWSTKTPPEILTDLQAAMAFVEKDALFKAKVIGFSPSAYNQLRLPYSTLNLTTLVDWLKGAGMYFDKFVVSRVFLAVNNGDPNSNDCFFVMDNDPEVAQLATVQEIQLGQQIYDILGSVKMAATLRTGGVMMRHPIAITMALGN